MSDDPIGQILAIVQRLEEVQTRLRAELMEGVDRLQDSLTQIRDDIAVNYGTAGTRPASER